MPFGAGGDLRRMRDEQHLRISGETLQPFADRIRDGAADAPVDFIKDERRG